MPQRVREKDQASRDPDDPFDTLGAILRGLAEIPERMSKLEAAIADLQPQSKMLVTVKEASQLLDLGTTKVYDLVRQGELTALRSNKLTRIPMRELERWISQKLTDQ